MPPDPRGAYGVTFGRRADADLHDLQGPEQAHPGAVCRCSEFGGLIRTAEQAKLHGWPIHVATRGTCAAHLDHGDDQREGFAFAQTGIDAEVLADVVERIDFGAYWLDEPREIQDPPGMRRMTFAARAYARRLASEYAARVEHGSDRALQRIADEGRS